MVGEGVLVCCMMSLRKWSIEKEKGQLVAIEPMGENSKGEN